jgi:hypothetical protein
LLLDLAEKSPDIAERRDERLTGNRHLDVPRRSLPLAHRPPTVKVEKQALKPGANVKASYQEKDGQKVATSLMVMPMR